jgi:hypothetical protein
MQSRENICEYPGCLRVVTGIYNWLLGRTLICHAHSRHLRVTKLFDKIYPNHGNCCGCDIKQRSGIWYTKRRCIKFEHTFIGDLLYINKNCILYYYKYAKQSHAYVSFYGSDIHDDWYVEVNDIDEHDIEAFNSSIYPYTYKCKLYEMRTDELYFGSIPRDILDEVIKYL